MNNVSLVGRITREVEIRYGQNQTAVCGFNLAINRPYKNAQGQYEADFIPCVAIGKSAEFMGKYVRKGDLLSVTGRIQTRTYQDQNGQNRAVTEVVVDNVMDLSPKPIDVPNTIPNQNNHPKPVDTPNTIPNQNNQQQPVDTPNTIPNQNNQQQPTQPKPQPQQPNSFGLDNDDDTLPWL